VHLVCCVGVPDDELAVLRGGDEMSAVGGPVHGVDLREMALEGPLRLHCEARQSLDAVSGDIADCTERVSIRCSVHARQRRDIRVVSASSSFFLFILSLSASASRRAIWIFCWMDSWFMSAMLHCVYQALVGWVADGAEQRDRQANQGFAGSATTDSLGTEMRTVEVRRSGGQAAAAEARRADAIARAQ